MGVLELLTAAAKGLKYRDKQPSTLTFTPMSNLELAVISVCLSVDCGRKIHITPPIPVDSNQSSAAGSSWSVV